MDFWKIQPFSSSVQKKQKRLEKKWSYNIFFRILTPKCSFDFEPRLIYHALRKFMIKFISLMNLGKVWVNLTQKGDLSTLLIFWLKFCPNWDHTQKSFLEFQNMLIEPNIWQTISQFFQINVKLRRAEFE